MQHVRNEREWPPGRVTGATELAKFAGAALRTIRTIILRWCTDSADAPRVAIMFPWKKKVCSPSHPHTCAVRHASTSTGCDHALLRFHRGNPSSACDLALTHREPPRPDVPCSNAHKKTLVEDALWESDVFWTPSSRFASLRVTFRRINYVLGVFRLAARSPPRLLFRLCCFNFVFAVLCVNANVCTTRVCI